MVEKAVVFPDTAKGVARRREVEGDYHQACQRAQCLKGGSVFLREGLRILNFNLIELMVERLQPCRPGVHQHFEITIDHRRAR